MRWTREGVVYVCNIFDTGKTVSVFFLASVEDKLNVVFGYIGSVAIMNNLSRMLQLTVPE